MSNVTDYQRIQQSSTSVTYAKNQAQEKTPKTRIVLTTPLLHIKAKSRKYEGKTVTRGFYLNLPKATVEAMDIQDKELVEITIRKIK